MSERATEMHVNTTVAQFLTDRTAGADTEDVREIRGGITAGLAPPALASRAVRILFRWLGSKIARLLGLRLSAIVLTAWSQYDEFLEFLDESRHDPAERIGVELAKHRILSRHTPTIKPILNLFPSEIRLNVAIDLEIEAGTVWIQNGEIAGFRIASGSGTIVVKWRDQILLNRTVQNLAFGEIDLTAGVPLQLPSDEVHSLLRETVAGMRETAEQAPGEGATTDSG